MIAQMRSAGARISAVTSYCIGNRYVTVTLLLRYAAR